MADITKINLKGTVLDIKDAGAARTSDLAAKQDALVSGTNIKTVNNESLLGSGDINIPAGSDGVSPHIDEPTGNWFIGDTDTGVHAQGPTGNVTVSDGVAEITIVNDLTTGGGGNVLSAEMGKVLGARQVYVTEDENHININVSSALSTLNVAPLTLAFNAIVGGNQTKTITVSGENLSQNVTLEIEGSTMFVLSQSSISPISGAVDATINVTYYPVGSSSQNATISVKVGNTVASVIRLQGVASLPSMALSTSSLGVYGAVNVQGTVYVIGSLLNGSVAVSSSSSDFTVSPSTISAADINAAGATGVPVTISMADNATDTSATITFTDATDSLVSTLSVTYEQPISVDDIFFKGGFRWKVLTSSTVELEHSTGDTSSASTYTGDTVTVPSSVTWAGTVYTVTSIGNSAFYKCSQIRQIVLPPNTITKLEYRALSDLAALQSVNLPDTITTMANAINTLPSLIELRLPNAAVTYSGDWCYSAMTVTTLIVPPLCTNPFTRNYSLCSSIIGTLRIETSSGASTNGMLFMNASAGTTGSRKAVISKLQVPTGLKATYSDTTNAYSNRWLMCLGWNGTDDGSSSDTLTAAIAKIEEITV